MIKIELVKFEAHDVITASAVAEGEVFTDLNDIPGYSALPEYVKEMIETTDKEWMFFDGKVYIDDKLVYPEV